MRIYASLYHRPCPRTELEDVVSWIRPVFRKLLRVRHYRDAYEILAASGSILGSAQNLGIRNLNLVLWVEMAERFIEEPHTPNLFKANAIALLASNGSHRVQPHRLAELESMATDLYCMEGHVLGAMDIRLQQVNRALKEDHNNLTRELLDELKGYFARYESCDAITSYEEAIDAVQGPLPEWKLFDFQVALSNERDQLAQRAGQVFIAHLTQIDLIGRWLTHSGKAASCVQAAEAIDATLREGDCMWLRGMAPLLASRAYAQLQDYRKAYDSATKSVNMWQGLAFKEVAMSTTVLLEARLNLHKDANLYPTEMADILSFAEIEIKRDIENQHFSHAADKCSTVFGHRNRLESEHVQYWIQKHEACVEMLSNVDPADGDIRRANLYQEMSAEMLASIKDADSADWEPCLANLDQAVAWYMKHSRLLQAANTRQMQSSALLRKYGLCPSAETLQRCFELVDVALDLFKEVGNVTFITTSSRWRSIIMCKAWENGWVAGDHTLAALDYAEDAWAAERADMAALAGLEALSRRQHFASLLNMRETYHRAFDICQQEGRVVQLWDWVQKAKARSLSDQLGVNSLVPAGLREQITQDPARRELLERAEALEKQIAMSTAAARLGLRGELDAIERQMKQDALLSTMMDIKKGTPVTMNQLQELGHEMEKHSPKRGVKFIDWVEHNGSFWLLVLDPDSKGPILGQCGILPSQVSAWKREWLDGPVGVPPAFSEDDFYDEEDPEFSLRKLDPLVAPLRVFTKPGDLLVFCPTGVLHSIPLHALYTSDDMPIIERNPIIYCASLTTFWQCCRRSSGLMPEQLGVAQGGGFHPKRWALTSMLEESKNRSFDSKEREDVYSLMSSTAAACNALSATGSDITKQFFLETVQPSSLFHFHGHGIFDRGVLAEQSLELADGSITVRDMFAMKLNAPHITLVACDSASQGIKAGDEPLGILTALLCAGAGSVLGTIWPTSSRTGRYFTTEFYDHMLEMQKRAVDSSAGAGVQAAMVDLAVVSQRAVLSLRKNMDTRHPYHWAAFVLHGSWFMRQGYRCQVDPAGQGTAQVVIDLTED